MTAAVEIDALAERLFRAFERNDPDEIAAVCSPAATFSRNGTSLGDLSVMLPVLANLRATIGTHRYVDARREIFDGGFVEEHGVEMIRPSGEEVRSAVCVIGRLGPDGRIAELAEYTSSGG